MTEQPTNRLARETSPYLRHHADNPVDWYPWGEEALARAREEDRPIFLSIGYAACHWCHVMERETFRDARIAEIMNERFVNIKVDREERPDLDDIYMTATQMLTKGGGWPNSVFLTPNLKPFFAGTYFPPEPRYGRPGFAQILISVADAYRDRREEVARVSDELAEGIRRMSEFTASKQKLSPALLNRAFGDLGGRFDASEGGFSGAPKFPHGTEFSFLLRYHGRTGNPEALRMVVFTLDKMARGGICDQLGGGFHRYAVDGQWIVPHFEKMLYDNALLSRVYLEAAQVVAKSPPAHAVPEGGDKTATRFRGVARETLDWVLREMTSTEGGFYSSLDADSEGEEGKFYVWTPQEIETHLGKQEAALFCSVHGVTANGDLPGGSSVLRLPKPLENVAQEFRTDLADLRLRMASARARLLQARERRPRPACDDKILADWNALMISALAVAARTLDAPQYGDAARAAAQFILDRMRPDGRLLHSYRDGEARHGGYLTDYAFLVAALIDLYETTFDPTWVREASDLARQMLDLFWEGGTGGFLLTARDHEQLIARTRENHDGAVPAGASVAALALPRLAVLTGDSDLSAKAETILRLYRDPIERFPAAFSAMLCALDQHLGTQRQVVLAGESGDPRLRPLERVLCSSYRPNTLVALADPKITGAATLPLLLDKKSAGDAPAAYVCEDGTCKPPVTSAEDLDRLLT